MILAFLRGMFTTKVKPNFTLCLFKIIDHLFYVCIYGLGKHWRKEEHQFEMVKGVWFIKSLHGKYKIIKKCRRPT